MDFWKKLVRVFLQAILLTLYEIVMIFSVCKTTMLMLRR